MNWSYVLWEFPSAISQLSQGILYSLLAYAWHCLLFCVCLPFPTYGKIYGFCWLESDQTKVKWWEKIKTWLSFVWRLLSGSLGKSMLFSLSGLKETFECLMLHALNILSCYYSSKNLVYSRICQTNTCQKLQLHHNFRSNLHAVDIAQVFLLQVSVRLAVSRCFRTAKRIS